MHFFEFARPTTRLFRLRAAFWILAGVAATACADKVLVPAARRSPVIRLQLRTTFAQQNAPTARTIDVRIGYDRTSGERVVLGRGSADVADGAQLISVGIDLTACIADENRGGARDACPLRVAIALRDTGAVALDSLELGPTEAKPGSTPQFPQAELAVQRFAARQWVFDEALQLGSNPPVNPLGLVGLVTGSGVPALYQFGLGTPDGNAVLVFENGRWRTVSFGRTDLNLTDLAMLSPTEGWLTAANRPVNGLFRFDGTGITAVPQIVDSLSSVSAISLGGSRLVFAASLSGMVWHGDGTTWTRDSLGTVNNLRRVCVTAADEAFVVNGVGTVWRWNGAVWTPQQPVPAVSGSQFAFQCPARGLAFLHLQQGSTQFFLSWNGSTWVTVPTTGPGVTAQIAEWAVVSPTEIYGWGQDANSVRHWYRYNGSTWTQIAQSAFGQGGANNVWADPRGGRVYYAAGFDRLEVYDAAANQRTTVSYAPAARDIMMSSPTNAVVAGWNLFLARWDGTRWTVDPPPANTPTIRVLQGAWTDGPSNAWAVGNNSTVFHWDGTRWNIVSDQNTPIATVGDNYRAVWGVGSTVLIAGTPNVLRCTSVTTCVNEVAPGAGALSSIWGTSLNNVFAVGEGGRILRNTGNSWSQMASPTTRALSRVWGISGSDVWAVGDSVLLHFDGTAWSDVPMTGALASMQTNVRTGVAPNSAIIEIGLWGSSANDVYLGGPGGRIARFDGKSWSLMPTPASIDRVVGITGAPGLGAIAILNFSTMLRGVGPNGGLGAPMSGPLVWQ